MAITASEHGQSSTRGRHETLPSLRQVFGDPDQLWQMRPVAGPRDARVDMPVAPGDALALQLAVESGARPPHPYGSVDGGPSVPPRPSHDPPARAHVESRASLISPDGSTMSRTKSGSGGDTSTEKKRKHSSKEQNRRNRMKDHYDAIRCIVPGCFPPPGSRPYSKEFVLKQTLRFLQALEAHGVLVSFDDVIRAGPSRTHRGSPRR